MKLRNGTLVTAMAPLCERELGWGIDRAGKGVIMGSTENVVKERNERVYRRAHDFVKQTR